MSAKGRRAVLGRGSDVRSVVRRGSRRSGRLMVVYVVPGQHLTRAAFVSGRRIGGAVARNRGRRLLREAWRVLATRVQGPFDMVFVAQPEIQGAKTQDVITDMSRALMAAGVAT